MNKDITEFTVCDFKPSKPKSLLGIRHVQVVMLFLAMFVILSTRINMSIAIVAMTDKNHEDAFDWTMQRQGVILSSFSWGYFICQIPAGELAARFGGSILITLIVACNAVVSVFIPLAAYYGGWQAVCACRMLQGLSQGFTYPVMHNLIGKWIPLEEKSRFATFIYAGAPLGEAIQLLASGFIIAFWGWPAVFYINGIVGAVWVVAYIMLGADSPQKSKRINDEERLYIQHSLDQVGKQKKLKTPWKALGTSLPFYALIVAQCGHSWGLFTMKTEMPSYIKNILQVDIKKNGAMSSLPYLAKFLLSFPFGFMSDYIIKKKWVSVSAARKISNTIGECFPAIALIGLSYIPAGNIMLSLALLTVVVGFNSAHYTGSLIVHIDMAPNHAGTMIGITNTCASIVSLIAPLAAGWILQNEEDPNQWNLVFYVSSAIYITANIFFVIFGTSKRQSWNKPEETDDEMEKKVEKAVQ